MSMANDFKHQATHQLREEPASSGSAQMQASEEHERLRRIASTRHGREALAHQQA